VTISSPPNAVSETRVGTVAYWRNSGISPGQLRALIRAGQLVQVRRGVYATEKAIASTKDNPARAHGLRAAAVRAATGGDAVASHQSAALIHGLDLLKRPPEGTLTLTRTPTRRARTRETAGVIFRAAELPREHVTRANGTAVTTVARTVIDLARTLSYLEAVVVADSALRAGTSKEELMGVVDACQRWPGMDQARRVIAFANGLAESVLESCARVAFDSSGLDAPQLQVTVRGPGFIFRADFLWAEHQTIVEADGLTKYSSKEDLLAQLRRDRLLRDAGYKVVHFTWRELFETPEVVIARIRRAFAAPTPY
jgi:predicted transcriptional regulator of viral defense system